MTIETIAEPTGSGTQAYGVDECGFLYSRGYGERHGLSWGGWKLEIDEARDWRELANRGSIYYYIG